MKEKLSVLGRGIYDLSEAARYAELHPNRVVSWFRPRGHMLDQPVFSSDYAALGMPRMVSFLNLIEILVVGQFRKSDVPLSEIRTAYDILRVDLKTDYPFSHRYLYAHGGKIFAKVVEEMGKTVLYEVVKRQGFSEELMKEHLEHIDYSKTSNLAERWRIARGIVIDPSISFGRPTVEGRATETLVLAKAFSANNEDAGFVGELFGVSRVDVENAVAFEKRFGAKKAA